MIASAREISICTSIYQPSPYFDVCEINGSKFALFNKAIDCDDNLSIDLSEYNVVFLAPIESKKNISIRAVSFIALSTITAKNGIADIHACGRVIMLGARIESHIPPTVSGDKGVHIYGIIKERQEMLLRLFQAGIAQLEGLCVAKALAETIDAIEDPAWENEDTYIDVFKALEYFSIIPQLKNDVRDQRT